MLTFRFPSLSSPKKADGLISAKVGRKAFVSIVEVFPVFVIVPHFLDTAIDSFGVSALTFIEGLAVAYPAIFVAFRRPGEPGVVARAITGAVVGRANVLIRL